MPGAFTATERRTGALGKSRSNVRPLIGAFQGLSSRVMRVRVGSSFGGLWLSLSELASVSPKRSSTAQRMPTEGQAPCNPRIAPVFPVGTTPALAVTFVSVGDFAICTRTRIPDDQRRHWMRGKLSALQIDAAKTLTG